MTQRSWPWRGPESSGDGPDDVREEMSPQPDAENRAYDRANRATEAERKLQGSGHAAPGELHKTVLAVSTDGVAGQAVGTAQSDRISGAILAIHVAYANEAPPTTDVRVSRKNANDESRAILLVPESRTDSYHAPNSAPMWRPEPTSFAYVPFVLDGEAVEVRVTDSAPLSPAVTVTVIYHAVSDGPA